jgi:hypothetical protein
METAPAWCRNRWAKRIWSTTLWWARQTFQKTDVGRIFFSQGSEATKKANVPFFFPSHGNSEDSLVHIDSDQRYDDCWREYILEKKKKRRRSHSFKDEKNGSQDESLNHAQAEINAVNNRDTRSELRVRERRHSRDSMSMSRRKVSCSKLFGVS